VNSSEIGPVIPGDGKSLATALNRLAISRRTVSIGSADCRNVKRQIELRAPGGDSLVSSIIGFKFRSRIASAGGN
jgi:hypothetical protein